MPEFSRTWWSDRFIKALEAFTEPARLGRGRSYARGGKVKHCEINQNKITAQVRGSVNPYFGVYKEPIYTISIEISAIAKTSWNLVLQTLSSKASTVSKLLMNEVPETIEETFSSLGVHLLPHSRKDFKTRCSCPDSSNPCKHIAGVYYLVASQLDDDPFLLFELRGLSRKELQEKLAQSPLGKALSAELNAKEVALEPAISLFSELQKQAVETHPTHKEFWLGSKRLPQTIDVATPTNVSAILIKKQGDFPAFWSKDNSFIEVMEELYQRVKLKNQDRF
jgi:uncharacterized Zn finger protein